MPRTRPEIIRGQFSIKSKPETYAREYLRARGGKEI